MKPWYVGRYEYTIDRQRRLAVPHPWREEGAAPDRFLLIPDRRGCIMAIPAEIFAQWVEGLRSGAIGDPAVGEALAELGFRSADVSCDSQGRITITPDLMQHAGLKAGGKALLVGAVLSILIWLPRRWEERDRTVQDPMATLADHTRSNNIGTAMYEILAGSRRSQPPP